MTMLAEVTPLLFLILVVTMIPWLRSRGRFKNAADAREAQLPRLGGAVSVPVKALENRGGFGGRSKNSLSPSLAILPDGLQYRIFREAHLPFVEIGQVDVRKGLFGGAELYVRGRKGLLSITVGDLGIAKAFLLALPPSVPLSADATALRAARVPANQR
jgi:hypothetical protein